MLPLPGLQKEESGRELWDSVAADCPADLEIKDTVPSTEERVKLLKRSIVRKGRSGTVGTEAASVSTFRETGIRLDHIRWVHELRRTIRFIKEHLIGRVRM